MNPREYEDEIAVLKAEIVRLEDSFHARVEGLRRKIGELERGADGKTMSAAPPPVLKAVPVRLPVSPAPAVPVGAKVNPVAPPTPVVVEPVAPAWATVPEGGREQQFGRVWLVRIGVAALLTGLVLGGNHAYQNRIRHLPNGLRLAMLFLLAGIMIETGRRLAKRETLRNFGEVILAGGLAFFYFCAYAAHGVARLRVIESPVLGALLLALAAGAIGAVSRVRQAKATALLAIVFASYATMVQPMGWLACVSGLLLASCGGWMMTRKGWNGPGWASMLCSYLSFVGWQWLGAAGHSPAEVRLWFLPCLWAVFAVPGILGKSHAMPSRYERAWFTGLNNGLFFSAFSLVWAARYPWENFWLVCAACGVVFTACGYYARKTEDGTSEPFIGQGVSCVTAALAMKLDGWHLGLALAMESLALAWMFRRYHKGMEWFLSIGAGVLATAGVMACAAGLGNMPGWSAGVASLFLFAAGAVMRREGDDTPHGAGHFSKAGAPFFLLLATVASLTGWWLALPGVVRLPVAAGMAALLTPLGLWVDRRRWWPQLGFPGLAYLACAVLTLTWRHNTDIGIWLAVGFAAAAMVLWRHGMDRLGKPFLTDGIGVDSLHPLPGWAMALFFLLAVFLGIGRCGLSTTSELFALGGVGVAMLGMAVVTRCGLFLPVGGVLLCAGVARAILQEAGQGVLFPLVGLGAVMAAGLCVPWVRRVAVNTEWLPAFVCTRAGLIAAWLVAWLSRRPQDWGDWHALGAIALLIACRALRWKPPVEFYLSVGGALLWQVMCWTGETGAGHPYAGWAVAAVFVVWAAGARRDNRDTPDDSEKEVFLALAGTTVVTAWVTRVTHMHFGWKPMAIVWTILGFTQVACGLAGRTVVVRIFGFLVLAAAVAKLFLMDVWDFKTVWRIATFIVLGIALVVLGLFYHRILPEVKSLFREDDAEKPDPPEPPVA